MTATFEAFDKIPRLRRDCTITEKIDGTNAAVLIAELPHVSEGSEPQPDPFLLDYWYGPDASAWGIYAQSRTRFLLPGKDDNFGFAAWVHAHADELVKLGPGRHFGEWWGAGIQRRYGQTEKRFSLFNTGRWKDPETRPACVGVVPELYVGPFSDLAVDASLDILRFDGSRAAPGFMGPEGIIVFMHASRTLHKVTLEKDEEPKGAK